jgi:hypothetical protein
MADKLPSSLRAPSCADGVRPTAGRKERPIWACVPATHKSYALHDGHVPM